jgi:uncharacterized Fe-S cluster protein YjdI
MEPITKHYSNGEITIVWKPGQCIHSAICFKSATGLPEVFNPKVRPWIKQDAASTEAIIQAIEACPSAALSYFRNNAPKEEPAPVSGDTIIEVMPDGPLMVYGNVSVKNAATGEVRLSDKVTALCRCGLSRNKPYCDGAHVTGRFSG